MRARAQRRPQPGAEAAVLLVLRRAPGGPTSRTRNATRAISCRRRRWGPVDGRQPREPSRPTCDAPQRLRERAFVTAPHVLFEWKQAFRRGSRHARNGRAGVWPLVGARQPCVSGCGSLRSSVARASEGPSGRLHHARKRDRCPLRGRLRLPDRAPHAFGRRHSSMVMLCTRSPRKS